MSLKCVVGASNRYITATEAICKWSLNGVAEGVHSVACHVGRHAVLWLCGKGSKSFLGNLMGLTCVEEQVLKSRPCGHQTNMRLRQLTQAIYERFMVLCGYAARAEGGRAWLAVASLLSRTADREDVQ